MIARLALALMLLAAPAEAAKRALVVGNDDYAHLPDLAKAVTDATGYEEVLKGLGYEVTLATDLDTPALQRTFGAFLGTIAPGDEVAFVYAGHGWSDGKANYLIGTDVEALTTLPVLRRRAVPLRNGVNGILDDLEAAGARVVVAVVDACRDNPFTASGTRSGSVGLTRGLTLVTAPPVPGPGGSFTVFSAGPGQQALDRLGEADEDPNSVFSRVFLDRLAKGGSLQAAVLDTVPAVAELAASIGHAQRPAYRDEIGERYCLSEGCAPVSVAVAGSAPEPVAPAAPPPKDEPVDADADAPVPAAPEEDQEGEPVTADDVTEPPTLVTPEVPMAEDGSAQAESAPAVRATPFLAPGEPIRVLLRAAAPLRSADGLRNRQSVCALGASPGLETLRAFARLRGFAGGLRTYRNVEAVVKELERGRCDAFAGTKIEIAQVQGALADPSRLVLAPETIAWTRPAMVGTELAPPEPEPATRAADPYEHDAMSEGAPLAPGSPVRVVALASLGFDDLAGLRGGGMCYVGKSPEAPTVEALGQLRGVTTNFVAFRSLRFAITALEEGRCEALAAAPPQIPLVMASVREPARYRVLDGVARFDVPGVPEGVAPPVPQVVTRAPAPYEGDGTGLVALVPRGSPPLDLSGTLPGIPCHAREHAAAVMAALAGRRMNVIRARSMTDGLARMERGDSCAMLLLPPAAGPLAMAMVREPSRWETRELDP